MLEEKFGLPTFINNDGNLYAYGEALCGYLPELNNKIAENGGIKKFRNLIGLTLAKGQEMKMDVGYIFGSSTGSLVAARAYWSNNSFSANVTRDIPHESRLEPAEWGTAVVE